MKDRCEHNVITLSNGGAYCRKCQRIVPEEADTPPKETAGWEVGFEVVLDSLAGLDGYFDEDGEFVNGNDEARQYLKSFIHSLLTQQREDMRGRVEGLRTEAIGVRPDGWNAALDAVIEEMER